MLRLLIGWGHYLQYSISGATVSNKAVAGRSARSYTREGRFQAIADVLKSGDYVIIEVWFILIIIILPFFLSFFGVWCLVVLIPPANIAFRFGKCRVKGPPGDLDTSLRNPLRPTPFSTFFII